MKPITITFVLAMSLVALSGNASSTGTGAEKENSKSPAPDTTDLPGKWIGSLELKGGNRTATIELEFTRAGIKWKAEGKITRDRDKQKLADVKADLRVNGAELSFKCTIEDAEFQFSGNQTGEKLKGTVEASVNGQVVDSGTWELKRIKNQ